MENLRSSDREYRTPILAGFYKIVAWLVLIATVLLFAFSVRGDRTAIPVLVSMAASGVLASLLAFGIAQVIEYIAKIEYHASSEKNDAILRSLHKIEAHLQAIREREDKA